MDHTEMITGEEKKEHKNQYKQAFNNIWSNSKITCTEYTRWFHLYTTLTYKVSQDFLFKKWTSKWCNKSIVFKIDM